MIDTDKYEGHTEGPWITKVNQQVYDKDNNPIATVEYFAQENHSHYNKVLIADAPLLLEEVKRLYREPRMTIDEWNTKPEGPCVTVYMNGCEYVGCLRLYKNEDGEVIE
tara:strand:- start:240 stop:566 length:327 start_codon:yes stop_codon:yes gene_type:complete